MDSEDQKNEIRELSSVQLRVLGVLMEKAFTTPEQYPLTLKSLTSGCNQKSNRIPVSQHSEDTIMSTLDELRDMLLVAEVFTDGGRAPRYRHYMRHRFDFSESEFAIIAELMLRGSQQPGELRTRASRMVRIESQESLRNALVSLREKGFVRANGPLERRGVIVDHTFYLSAVTPKLSEFQSPDESSNMAVTSMNAATEPGSSEAVDNLRVEVEKQRQEIDSLKHTVARLEDLMR
ncbi:MAG: YceH family protein [Fuerstiella sp.]|nr:YceH family protein [Fuerstiella sp.]